MTEQRLGLDFRLPEGRKKKNTALNDGGTPSLMGIVIKIILLALLDAAMLFAVMVLITNQDYLFAGIVTLVTVLVNWAFLKRGNLPAKYLLPGLIFMLIFQVFVVGYSAYIAFTNYGTMHNSDKPDAINALLLNGQTRVPEANVYPLSVVEGPDGGLGFLVTFIDQAGNQEVKVGQADQVFSPAINPAVQFTWQGGFFRRVPGALVCSGSRASGRGFAHAGLSRGQHRVLLHHDPRCLAGCDL